MITASTLVTLAVVLAAFYIGQLVGESTVVEALVHGSSAEVTRLLKKHGYPEHRAEAFKKEN